MNRLIKKSRTHLIYHYVDEHHYLPPKEFLVAVLDGALPGFPEYEALAARYDWYENYKKDYARAIDEHAEGYKIKWSPDSTNTSTNSGNEIAEQAESRGRQRRIKRSR